MRAIVIAAALCGVASAEPSDRRLVYVGLALAPVDYVAGVALHEASHALAAKLVGGDVDELHVFPPGTDPHSHSFRFGWTYVHGLHSTGDKLAFYLAPKLVDATLLGGFAALVLTSAWPRSRYGQLALTVGATGLWVDFAKDVVAFSPNNDVVKVLDLWCMRGWRQLSARLVYAGISVALGLVVARGYERTFTTPGAPVVVPLAVATF